MRKRWILVSVLVIGLTAGGITLAATRNEDDHHGRPLRQLIMARLGRAMALQAELNLTPEQRQAIRETLKANRAQIADALKPVVENGRALRDAVQDGNERQIRAAADRLGKSIGDAAVVGAKVRSEVREAAQLTDEQIEKIDEFRGAADEAVDRFLQRLGESR